MALTYIHEGIAKVLLCPQHLDQSLGAPPYTLYGKIFAFKGDLFDNQGLNVELLNDIFSLAGNQLLVPKAQVIKTAVAADANTKMLGPLCGRRCWYRNCQGQEILCLFLSSMYNSSL